MSKVKEPRLVVGALIKKGDEQSSSSNKYLLVKEKLEDQKETWIIPGGGVDFGESLEEAVVREVKEELGLRVKIIKFIRFQEAIFPKYNYHTIIFFYLCQPLGEKIKIGEKKILDAKYFSRKEIKDLNLVDSAKWLLE